MVNLFYLRNNSTFQDNTTGNSVINLNSIASIKDILQSSKTIAVVGLSPKAARPSNQVAKDLLNAGYSIIPVNPGQDTIFGLPCYPDLESIPVKVDIVDIFRRSEDVDTIVDQAISINAPAIWMQLGVINQTASDKAKQHDIKVVMDRCIKIDHAELLG